MEQEPDDDQQPYPFCVDTWSSSSTLVSSRRRHYFLTHAHHDHTLGITAHFFSPIYCTAITAQLVLLRHTEMCRSQFLEICIEEPRLIQDEGGSFTVTAYDANHCPGAVMFLFEGDFGVVLHTGDCRLTPECYMRLPKRLFNGSLNCIFLDCTFAKSSVRMPHKDEAINQVKQCIWNHPDAPIVYLACDLLGQEMLLRNLSHSFGFKIFVDKNDLREFYISLAVVTPDIVTDDPKATRLHVCGGFPKLYDRVKHKFSEAHSKGEPEPLFLRPSAQWYAYGERLEGIGSGLLLLEKIYKKAPSITCRRIKSAPREAERDPYGIWHVCYSMHSSQEELNAFLSKMKPKRVVSTTPHYKASDLSFVKELKNSACNNLKYPRITNMATWEPTTESKHDIDVKNEEISTEADAVNEPTLFHDTSPLKNIPLFGRAVLGLPPSPSVSFDFDKDFSSDEEGSIGHVDVSFGSENAELTIRENKAYSHDFPTKPNEDEGCVNDTIRKHGEYKMCINEKDECSAKIFSCPKGSDKVLVPPSSICHSQENSNSLRVEYKLGENAKRTYRSLNMLIPRPLPSLLELDKEIKRSRY